MGGVLGWFLTGVLLLALVPTGAQFTARWATPTSARLAWTQPPGVALTCLARNATLIRCWADLPAGPIVVTLGNRGPLDAAYRPHAGDVFTLDQDGVLTRAALRCVLYFPVVF